MIMQLAVSRKSVRRHSRLCFIIASLKLFLAFLVCPLFAQQNDKFNFDILIRNPDGSLAKEIYITQGDRHERFDLQVQPANHEELVQKNEDELGNFKVQFRPASKFVAFWNEFGYAKQSIASFEDIKELQLQAWASLKIRVHSDALNSGIPIAVSSWLTSDKLHQGLEVNVDAKLSDDGTVEFKKIPPGELTIRVNYRQESKKNVSWYAYDRLKTTTISPGGSVSLDVGAEGSGVIGKIVTNNRDFDMLHGHAESSESNEQVPLQILEDGRFTTAPISFGKLTIRIYDRDHRSNRYGLKAFNLKADGAEIENLKYVGTVAVGTRETIAEIESQLSSTPFKVIQTKDTFQSEKQVSFVAAINNAGRQSYVFLDEKGVSIRALEGIDSPSAWSGGRSFVTADPKRKCFYLIGQATRDTHIPEGVLIAFNLKGTELYRLTLPPLSSGQIAVDTDTGNLWLLSRQNLRETNVVVLDQIGKTLHSSDSSAFTLKYSVADKAIWLLGPDVVERVDPASYRISATYQLPEGIFTLSGAVALPMGGILAKEVYHPDMPKSTNRLWKFDSDAKVTSTKDLRSVYPNSISAFREQLIVAGIQISGLRMATASSPSSAQRYESDLESVGEPLGDVILVTEGSSQDSVTVLKRDGIYEFSIDKDGSVRCLRIVAITDVGWLWPIAP